MTFPQAYVLLIPRIAHQVRYGYPPEVISQAQSAASALLAAVTSGA